MTEQEFNDQMKPGEYAVDNSKHRYGKHIGYQWTAKSQQGVLYTGVESTKTGAEHQCFRYIKSFMVTKQ